MDEVTAAHARGAILKTLKLHLERERPPGEDAGAAYMEESLLQTHLAQFHGLPMLIGELRGLCTYLHDAGLVKYRETRIGRTVLLSWRILHLGTQVLEGHLRDPGVQV